MPTGRLRQFDHSRGFGFVGTGSDSAFVHISALRRSGIPEAQVGDVLHYSIQHDDRGRTYATDLELASRDEAA